MHRRLRIVILAWSASLAILGSANSAQSQVPPAALAPSLDITARVGLGGWHELGPHVAWALASGRVRLDMDYGAAPYAVVESEVQSVETLCRPPQCSSYRWLSSEKQVHSSTLNHGRMLRLGIGYQPNDWFAVGARAVPVGPGFAWWFEAGRPVLQLYAGRNDGGLVALPLLGHRLGVRSRVDLGELLVRVEVALGMGMEPADNKALVQGALIIAHPLNYDGLSGELAVGGASAGAEHHLQAAVGLRWVGRWVPTPGAKQRRLAKSVLAAEPFDPPDAAHWLGRETTWLHRPTGLAQTCTVTEAVAMADMAWLHQTCTAGPADAVVPWATGCYVVDHQGLWRLPVCPGEAPGKLTRPLLIVPSRGSADPRFVDLNDATWQQRLLKLQGREVQVDCQRVPGLQTYEACSSQTEGLLFASVRATLPADRKRWPVRSTELVSLRKVEVSGGQGHFGEEMSQCHWSSACRVLGECRSQGARCVAQRDEDCAASAVCALRGACGVAAGRCAPTAAAMCESSENCRRLGQCQLGKVAGAPACVAAEDASCQAAQVCATQGFCRAERGRCVAGGERPGEGLPDEASPTGVGR